VSQAVLLIEPESSGLELIRAAAAFGYSVVIFDTRPITELSQPARDAVTTGAATYRQIDTPSVPAIVAAWRQLALTTELVAVIPGFELAVPVAAATAAELDLPGIDPLSAQALRDKRRMKETLQAAGVPVSRGVAVDAAGAGDEELTEIEKSIGYPAVVKPVDGSGSVFVRRVDDHATLREFIAEIGAFSFDALGRRLAEQVLIESYVPGPEFSVEGYAQDGEVVVVAVTAKLLGREPRFVEIGHTVEADLAPEQRFAIAETAAHAVRALGLTAGVFHVELRLTAGGPVILEVGGRLAGDHIPALISAVHGVDLPTVLVEILAGRRASVDAVLPANGVAAIRYFVVEEPSVLVGREELHDELSGLPGAREVQWYLAPDAALQPAVDFRGRFGHILVGAPDRQVLEATLVEADRLVKSALRPL
jgi:biotin carboxylase